MRFHLDEHVDSAIAEGLRQRGIDVTTTAEAGLLSAEDQLRSLCVTWIPDPLFNHKSVMDGLRPKKIASCCAAKSKRVKGIKKKGLS